MKYYTPSYSGDLWETLMGHHTGDMPQTVNSPWKLTWRFNLVMGTHMYFLQYNVYCKRVQLIFCCGRCTSLVTSPQVSAIVWKPGVITSTGLWTGKGTSPLGDSVPCCDQLLLETRGAGQQNRKVVWFPLVSCSNWSDCGTESRTGSMLLQTPPDTYSKTKI